MGNQQCGNHQEELDDIKYFRGSPEYADQSYDDAPLKRISYCKAMGVGIHMKVKYNKQVSLHWEQLIRQTGITLRNSDQAHYEQPQIGQNDKELRHLVQEKYNFMVTQEDLALLMIYVMDQQGMKFIMRKGVPNHLRWAAWKTVLLVHNVELLKRNSFENMINKECIHSKNIEKDVMRTLISSHFFSDKSEGYGQDQLIRVLVAVANFIPQLGYCQGMNFLVGFLLMVSGCDERNSYSCMLSLLCDHRYLLYYFFCDGLPLFQLVQFMVCKLLEKNFPRLSKHLVETETPESFWLTKILLSVFLYVFKMPDCQRLWDYFLARGSIKGYLELILGIISLLEEKMLTFNNLDIANHFSGTSKIQLVKIFFLQQEFDVDLAICNAQNKYRIKKNEISKLAKEYIKTQNLNAECFESTFTLFDDKVLFDQAIDMWIKKIL